MDVTTDRIVKSKTFRRCLSAYADACVDRYKAGIAVGFAYRQMDRLSGSERRAADRKVTAACRVAGEAVDHRDELAARLRDYYEAAEGAASRK